MKRWKHGLAASLAALYLVANAGEAAFLSDLWWKPDESGWGANVVHQDDVAFVTLFVHSPSGEPTWYAAEARQVALTPGGLPVVSGPLYRTQGPWFGGPFDASQVRVTPVGRLSITPEGTGRARFDYDVHGVGVSKILNRQSLQVPLSEAAGLGYAVTMALTLRQPDRLPETSRSSGTAEIQIFHDAAAMIVHDAVASCVHAGPIVQQGRFTNVSGTYTCTDGRTGNVEINELEFSRNGFTARIAMTTPGGILSGSMAGAAR